MNCDDIKCSNDKFLKESVLDIVIEETQSPFENIIKEVNNNIKDVGGPDEVNEGGQGSGRNPEQPGDAQGGASPGPLVTFETTLIKEMLDAKVKCPCNKNK